MNRATLFLNDLTCLDHAFINDRGNIIGGSYMVGVELTGEVDPVEEVVVDFSTIKKALKEAIDDKEKGFDHKLWIRCYDTGVKLGDTYVEYTSSSVRLRVPKNAVRFLRYSPDRISEDLAIYLQEVVDEKYPSVKVVIENVTLTHRYAVPAFHPTDNHHKPMLSFNYTHGLRNSTSWGCQSLGHGHHSFIDFAPKNGRDSYFLLCSDMELFLENAVFIDEDNIFKNTEDEITISYETARGTFSATYNKHLNNVIVLPVETTVEHLAEFIGQKFEEHLKDYGIERLYVSEGLQKGSFYNAQWKTEK